MGCLFTVLSHNKKDSNVLKRPSEEVIEDEPAIKISNLQLELKSIKSQSDNTLARLTQIDNRLNQIEKRFAHLEGCQNQSYVIKSAPWTIL